MYDVNSNIDHLIERLHNIVCDIFNCSNEDLYSRNKSGNITCARSMCYYFLHDMLSVSSNKVARIYGRTSEHIKTQNAKTRFLVKTNDTYKKAFLEIEKRYEKG